jgi:hypothetical protein
MRNTRCDSEPGSAAQRGIWPVLALISFLLLICAPVSAQDPLIPLLKELTDAPGPPGFEEPVRKIMVEHMRPYANKISFDGLGP